ncbi:peptide deformylase [Cryptosporangium phraense]|uniref:Peptide deformylase n=1 Tax=Cryptosporangium phraense TaxID=2593070 RepID=A0A545AU01_9ACTN|nr:peptide deformylase [Cryptosporangium phraense]TQS44819.1 peptide deformylase [Cryptosporangium phraense]
MRELGISQVEDDPGLLCPVDGFAYPFDAALAVDTMNQLREAVRRIRQVHTFSKGMGLAAPQIGIARRAAIVFPAGSDEAITLVNPRIVDRSPTMDVPRFEGCLSFFDVRGRVRRPLAITVEHQREDGTVELTTFGGSVGRLVAHEIDHLDGILYSHWLEPGEGLISVEDYRGTGVGWQY